MTHSCVSAVDPGGAWGSSRSSSAFFLGPYSPAKSKWTQHTCSTHVVGLSPRPASRVPVYQQDSTHRKGWSTLSRRLRVLFQANANVRTTGGDCALHWVCSAEGGSDAIDEGGLEERSLRVCKFCFCSTSVDSLQWRFCVPHNFRDGDDILTGYFPKSRTQAARDCTCTTRPFPIQPSG